MPYRPQKRRASRTGNGNGNGTHHRGSYAARLAIARSTARKPQSRGPNALLVLFLVLVVAGITVASGVAIAAGGAAGVTIATLNEGLPDVKAFRDLDYWQPTTIYDRKGKTVLAQFWEHRREVVKFDEIPPLVLDVTTATEDDTFWENPGVDLEATTRALLTTAAGGDTGGASTITQQLVRARLLPEEIIENDNTQEGLYVRKAKEILQSYKLTQAFPGERGKKDIITAYLNEIFYGGAYGIAAAADVYFGKDLDELTPSEAALLAAIPQSPAKFNLWAQDAKGKWLNLTKERVAKGKKNGKRKTRLVLRTCAGKGPTCEESELVARRDYILGRLRDGKGRWTRLSEEQYQQALREKIVVRKRQEIVWQAPHFVNAVLPELQLILADRDPIKVGGYKVTTTLDMKAQNIAEKYIYAGAVVPNLPASQYFQAIRKNKLGRDAGWISRLRGLNLKNGAMVAMDYRSGDILAYVGSAGYYKKKTPKMNPKYDHAGQGRRQPGSAWKPIVYATGIDTGALTAGTVLLDITTQFGPGWSPRNASFSDSGPILVRDALQKSLNVPAIRALHRTGIKTVRKYSVKAGLTFLEDYGNKALDAAGLAGAIGTVEVRPVDLTAVFGAFGNDGKVTQPRHILKVEGPDGELIYKAGDPITTQVWKPATAYIIADILEGNTDLAVNPDWARIFELRNTKSGARRPAAVKTGTTNQLKDYSTYGFLPQPKSKKAPALAVGVWFGNSDSTSPNLNMQIYSMDNAGQAWHSFVRDYMNNKPAPEFPKPKTGIVAATIDKYTGGAPGNWTRGTRTELFVRGTEPGGKRQVDPAGLLYSGGCVDPANAENPGAPSSWINTVNTWAARGGRGYSSATKSTAAYPGSAGPVCGTRSGKPSDKSDDSGGSSGGGSSGGGGGNGPAPTCQPGFTDKPRGCVIPSN